jgi:hypothetical protein
MWEISVPKLSPIKVTVDPFCFYSVNKCKLNYNNINNKYKIPIAPPSGIIFEINLTNK